MLVEVEYHVTGQTQIRYTTFLKYYPTRYTVGDEYEENRRIVYLFKDGIQVNQVDNLFVGAIKALKQVNPNREFWICPIPSSKIEKTRNRYFNFCLRISNLASIHNGYSLITPIEDRDEVHKGGTRNYNRILDCLEFDSDVRGRNIILIDDVITTGRSFSIIARRLKEIGAKSVFGIVLAKTHWLDESGELAEEGYVPEDSQPDIPPNLEYLEPMGDDFY